MDAVVRFSGVLEAAAVVDMMERPLATEEGAALERVDGVVSLRFGPYEIKTLRLQLSGAGGSRPRL